MKTVKILFLLLLYSASCVGQNNKRDLNQNTMIEKTAITGHWRIDEIIGLELIGESLKTDEYTIQELLKENNRNGIHYGWQVEFRSDMSFASYYTAPDGFDYFSSVTGTYKWIDESHIKIHVGEIALSGRWHLNEKPDVDLGVFIVNKTDNGFRLIKCATDETDKQRLSYSDLLRSLPEIRAGWTYLRWIKLPPPYNHKRDAESIKIQLNKGLAADGTYNPDKAKLVFSRMLNRETAAFVFRYEGKSVAALYGIGPQMFAVTEGDIPSRLDVFSGGAEESLIYLIRLEKDERKKANLPKKKNYKDLFLHCEIVTNWYDAKKGSKREIFTLHYLHSEFYDPETKSTKFRYDINRRMEFSQLSRNGKTEQNNLDTTSWKYVGNTGNVDEESIYIDILDYYWENEKDIPVLRDK